MGRTQARASVNPHYSPCVEYAYLATRAPFRKSLRKDMRIKHDAIQPDMDRGTLQRWLHSYVLDQQQTLREVRNRQESTPQRRKDLFQVMRYTMRRPTVYFGELL